VTTSESPRIARGFLFSVFACSRSAAPPAPPARLRLRGDETGLVAELMSGVSRACCAPAFAVSP
jgi:hypothetical protein